MRLEIHAPMVIGPRLLPALQIGKAWVHLETSGADPASPAIAPRTVFRWTIDLPGYTASGADLRMPAHGRGARGEVYREAFGALLAFLEACAESVNAGDNPEDPDSNAGLFPGPIGEWCGENSDALAMARLYLEEVRP